jgi:hypothetical protein
MDCDRHARPAWVLEDRQSLAEIADFLGRTEVEIAARSTELGYILPRSDRAMPGPVDQLTDEEREAVITALRQLIDRDRYPQAPRLAPSRAHWQS